MAQADSKTQDFHEAEQRLFRHYGLDYQSHYVQLKDPPLRARVIEVGSGPPLFLVHGGGANAAFWAPLLKELKGYRLLAVDRPGCGLTDPFNYRSCDLRSHAVSFLDGVLDALELENVPVIANSMGGLWSLWLALERPQRLSSLLLMGCPALILNTGAPLPMRLLSVPGLNRVLFSLEKPSRQQARRLLRRIGHRTETLDGLPEEFFDCMYRSGQLPNFKLGWLSLLERVLRIGGPDPKLALRAEQLAQLTQPVLFLWGDNDPFGGAEVGRRAAEAAPQAKLEVISGGHLPWLDDPVFCAKAAEGFLEQIHS
ncbi:MAG TPA: alpha/beta hydrolase [Dehalococcoidia bacterium]|nr:alpha/beta hydrolase [Dehalococcoidia bacterium]